MSDEIRLLVFGGRRYPDRERVFDGILQIIGKMPMEQVTIIHGACNYHDDERPHYWQPRIGADYWAHLFCDRWWYYGLKEKMYPAKWRDLRAPGAIIRTRSDGTEYNVRAGFDRNQYMLDDSKPTHALGAPGGTGTADMKRRILRANEHGANIRLSMIEDSQCLPNNGIAAGDRK